MASEDQTAVPKDAPVPASTKEPSGFGISHTILVAVANFAIESFFKEIKIVGRENVPLDGAVIFACSHSNMAVDPACLSYGVIATTKSVSKRFIHYWVKDSLFKNPIAGAILLNAGNIPVDRKTKNNQILFRGTFEALVRGEVVGVFPEGTSHNHSKMMPIKDGVAWTALEYLAYLEEHHGGANVGGKAAGHKPAVVVPVGLTYSDKTKYRSRVAIEFGKPITMDEYADEFLSGKEGAPKSAVKRLTKRIEDDMKRLTINSADWDTLNAANMATQLLWADEKELRMENYKEVVQTFVDLFADPEPFSPLFSLKQALVSYHAYLTNARMDNSSLSQIPLPATLDPSRPIPLPTRFSTLAILVRDVLSTLIRIPFFALPFLVNIPVYVMACWGARLVDDEQETQAQMKVMFGLLVSALVYPIVALAIYGLAFRAGSVLGGLIGLGITALFVWGLGISHRSLIDENYESGKKLVTAFRILLGLWSPNSLDITLPTPILSRANSTVGSADALKHEEQQQQQQAAAADADGPLSPGASHLPPPYEPDQPRIPSRRLIRQVLRTRTRASKGLVAYVLSLEHSDDLFPASAALATTSKPAANGAALVPTGGSGGGGADAQLFRKGRDIYEFLRVRGARLRGVPVDLHWLEEQSSAGARSNGEVKKER